MPMNSIARLLLGVAFLAGRCWADGDAIVMVNGAPISKDRVVNLLLDAYGLNAMQQLIALDLARQEAARRKLTVTAAEVDAEFRSSLDEIAREAGMSTEDATEENKLAALKVVLRNRGVSMAEYKLGIERNAHLRKLVMSDLKVDEPTLREEFARTYGERVIVRHIQIPTSARGALQEAQAALRGGTDFAEVAQRFSRNGHTASRGGEMDPFTFDDDRIPAAMREIAFALKPGEISNVVQTDNFFQILKLERRLPPDNVRYEDVREKVKERLSARVARTKMDALMVELFQKAKINVLDSKLKREYDEFLMQKETAAQP